MFRLILLVAVAFAAGWEASRYFAPVENATQAPAAQTIQAASNPAPAASPVPVPPVTVDTASAPAASAPRGKPAIPSGPNRIVDPNQNQARGDPSKREQEEHLLDVIRDRFPEARIMVRRANSDGTTASKETLDDGSTISRSFNEDGQLVGESWKQAAGDEVIRTYYDGGGIKGFSMRYANGNVTNITFTQSGLFKARSDDYSDGTHVYTGYDDNGQVLDQWSKGKDGKSVRVF